MYVHAQYIYIQSFKKINISFAVLISRIDNLPTYVALKDTAMSKI